MLGGRSEDGTHKVMMDKEAFTNRIRGYQSLADRMRQYLPQKNTNLSDVTISKKLIAEENDHAVKTRVPGTWGKDVRYVWLHKENVMDIHNGKTMLTFLDTSKDYKLYDEQNRVVTTKKGDELYTHYDKVESSVRERYEKVQKEQKKDHKEENGYYQKREVGAYADNEEKTVTDIYFSGCSVIRVSWLSDKWCMDRRDCL